MNKADIFASRWRPFSVYINISTKQKITKPFFTHLNAKKHPAATILPPLLLPLLRR